MRFVTAKNAATNFIMSYNFFFETAFGEATIRNLLEYSMGAPGLEPGIR